MKTIGLIGGMSWESTATYYSLINNHIKDELGGLNSAKILLYSLNFKEVEELQSLGDWDKNGKLLAEAALTLEKAGADFVLICTNTMHKIADTVSKKISKPLLHIGDVTADELIKNNVKKVALLGTKYTMEQDFYKKRLINRGLDVVVPCEKDRIRINKIIFNELCVGKICEGSKKEFLDIIDGLSQQGIQGVILGCTEIGLIINQNDTNIKLFDTTLIHAKAAADMALQ